MTTVNKVTYNIASNFIYHYNIVLQIKIKLNSNYEIRKGNKQ